MTRVKSVVLPAPLHPARPMTFINFSRAARLVNLPCDGRRGHNDGCGPFVLATEALYRSEALVMLCCRYDEDRENPRPPDPARSEGSAADRARGGPRPDRGRNRDQRAGGTAADALPEFAGDRHDDDDRRLPRISGARLFAQPEHAQIRR